MTTRLVIGITGASGVVYGIRLLEVLNQLHLETHAVLTSMAEKNIELETKVTPQYVRTLATKAYDVNDLAATLSSGSFHTNGMVVIPCSMKTLAGIANGFSENLLLRAADVTIKEQRPLIISPRESPLNPIHLENMLKLARIGVTILPPSPAFYNIPKSIEEIIDQTIGKILDILGIEHNLYKRWTGSRETARRL